MGLENVRATDMNRTATDPEAEMMAQQGRYGDSEMAHVTPDEIIVPLDIQDEETLNFLKQKFDEYGIPMDRYVVGDDENSENPNSGEEEYFSLGKVFKSVAKIAAPIVGNALLPGGGGALLGNLAAGLIDGGGSAAGGGGVATAGGGGGVATTPLTVSLSDPKNYMKSADAPSLISKIGFTQQAPEVEEDSATPPLSQDRKKSSSSVNSTTGQQEFYGMAAKGMRKKKPMQADRIAHGQGGHKRIMPKPSTNPNTGKKEFASPYGTMPMVKGQTPPPPATRGGNFTPTPTPTAAPAPSAAPAANSNTATTSTTNTTPSASPAPSTTVTPSPTPAPTPAPSPYVDETYYGAGRNDRENRIRTLGYSGAFGKGAADSWLQQNFGTTDVNSIPVSGNKPMAYQNYDQNLYYGEGRNDRESKIRQLGYTGAFGKGEADSWMYNKFGTTNLDTIPASAYQSQSPSQSADNYTQSLLDRINKLINQYSTPNTPAATPAAPSSSPSSLTPMRAPSYRSRRWKRTLATNF